MMIDLSRILLQVNASSVGKAFDVYRTSNWTSEGTLDIITYEGTEFNSFGCESVRPALDNLFISSTFNPLLSVGNYLAIQNTGKFVAQEDGTYRFSFTGTLIAPNWPTNAKNFLHLKKDGTVSDE